MPTAQAFYFFFLYQSQLWNSRLLLPLLDRFHSGGDEMVLSDSNFEIPVSVAVMGTISEETDVRVGRVG